MAHKRFHPCVSHVRSTCRFSNDEDDVMNVGEYIMATTPQEGIHALRSDLT